MKVKSIYFDPLLYRIDVHSFLTCYFFIVHLITNLLITTRYKLGLYVLLVIRTPSFKIAPLKGFQSLPNNTILICI